jgi:hypothetical protein
MLQCLAESLRARDVLAQMQAAGLDPNDSSWREMIRARESCNGVTWPSRYGRIHCHTAATACVWLITPRRTGNRVSNLWRRSYRSIFWRPQNTILPLQLREIRRCHVLLVRCLPIHPSCTAPRSARRKIGKITRKSASIPMRETEPCKCRILSMRRMPLNKRKHYVYHKAILRTLPGIYVRRKSGSGAKDEEDRQRTEQIQPEIFVVSKHIHSSSHRLTRRSVYAWPNSPLLVLLQLVDPSVLTGHHNDDIIAPLHRLASGATTYRTRHQRRAPTR